MIIELDKEYIIDESEKGSVLKKRYTGIRNGQKTQCEKRLGFYPTTVDAMKAFLRLSNADKNKDTVISVSEYIKSLNSCNEAVGQSDEGIFFIYVPNGSRHEESSTNIAELIPVGRENAISRNMLLQKCVNAGLIDDNCKYKDRIMRRMIESARIDYTIMNLSNGKGYYRPSHDDLLDLQRYIRQEEHRAKAIFKNISMAKKLYEDYKSERIKE